jgi:hypothetical protein
MSSEVLLNAAETPQVNSQVSLPKKSLSGDKDQVTEQEMAETTSPTATTGSSVQLNEATQEIKDLLDRSDEACCNKPTQMLPLMPEKRPAKTQTKRPSAERGHNRPNEWLAPNQRGNTAKYKFKRVLKADDLYEDEDSEDEEELASAAISESKIEDGEAAKEEEESGKVLPETPSLDASMASLGFSDGTTPTEPVAQVETTSATTGSSVQLNEATQEIKDLLARSDEACCNKPTQMLPLMPEKRPAKTQTKRPSAERGHNRPNEWLSPNQRQRGNTAKYKFKRELRADELYEDEESEDEEELASAAMPGLKIEDAEAAKEEEEPGKVLSETPNLDASMVSLDLSDFTTPTEPVELASAAMPESKIEDGEAAKEEEEPGKVLPETPSLEASMASLDMSDVTTPTEPVAKVETTEHPEISPVESEERIRQPPKTQASLDGDKPMNPKKKVPKKKRKSEKLPEVKVKKVDPEERERRRQVKLEKEKKQKQKDQEKEKQRDDAKGKLWASFASLDMDDGEEDFLFPIIKKDRSKKVTKKEYDPMTNKWIVVREKEKDQPDNRKKLDALLSEFGGKIPKPKMDEKSADSALTKGSAASKLTTSSLSPSGKKPAAGKKSKDKKVDEKP